MKRRIHLGRNKTKLREAIIELHVPWSRRLLQVVKRALQLANMGQIPGVFKIGRLLHVDILTKEAWRNTLLTST
jgi:hypothetical protein